MRVRDVSGKTDGGEVDSALASVEEVVRRVARQEVWKKKTGRERWWDGSRNLEKLDGCHRDVSVLS